MKALMLAAAVLSVGLMSAAQAGSVSDRLGIVETKTYRIAPGQSAQGSYQNAFNRPVRAQQRAFSGPTVNHFGGSSEHRRVLREDARRMNFVDRESLR